MMFHDVSIEVDLETLENQTNIIGQIYFILEYHKYFPEQDWSDFVVIVLSWWIKSCKGLLLSKAGTTYEFDFMDGIPIVYAKKLDNRRVELIFCEDSLANIECSGTFTIQQLRDSLLSASKKVIRAVDRNNWTSSDIEELRDLILSLKKYPM